MKRLFAVLCLSIVVLVPAAATAFTLYTPSIESAASLVCSIVNVGRITLQVQVIPYHVSGPMPGAETWEDLAPGASRELGHDNYDRCVFKVRAKNPRQIARKDMVRAAARFDNAYSFEAW